MSEPTIIKQATNISIGQMDIDSDEHDREGQGTNFGQPRRSHDASLKSPASADNISGSCGVGCILFGQPRNMLEESEKPWRLLKKFDWALMEIKESRWRGLALVGDNCSAGEVDSKSCSGRK